MTTMGAIAELADEAKASLFDALLRTDLVTFIGKAHATVSPGVAFVPSWHLEAIAHALDALEDGGTRRLLITLPPRSMKSTCVTIAFTARLLGRHPRLRIISASYSDALSAKFSQDTRRVMQSAWYRRAFPGAALARQSEGELVTVAGGSRLATSVGGTLTGRGADVVVIDDPHKAEDAHSEAARTKVRDWYDGTLLSRLNDMGTGRIVVVMQRLHVDDLAGHLIAQGGWTHLDLPAIAPATQTIPIGAGRSHTRLAGDVLQPSRDSAAELEALRRQIGTGVFSAQYQQTPVPPGGNMIDWDWLPRFELPLRSRAGDTVVQSWDTANTASELADYSVGLTFVQRGETLYLIDVVRERSG